MTVWLMVTRSVGTATVPDVTGRDVEDVRPVLSDRGVRYRITETSSLQSPEGQVIRQIPPAGARIKESRAVQLFVSQGPRYVPVPDLTGQSLLEARNELLRDDEVGGDVQFSLGSIARVFSEQEPEEHVIAQQPRSGEEAVQGSEIDVLISKGPWPRRTVIPPVVGEPLDRARRLLDEAYLEAANIRYTYRADSVPSAVLDQFPPSGRLVERNESVSLMVNLSEPEIPEDELRYTSIRINPPLDVSPRPLRVIMNDQRGSRVVFDREVNPGESIQFLASVKGKAELEIYWNGDFYRYRTLESSV